MTFGQQLRAMFGEVFHDREAVDARHHQIERDDVVVVLEHLFDGLAAIARAFDDEAVPRQDARDQDANPGSSSTTNARRSPATASPNMPNSHSRLG